MSTFAQALNAITTTKLQVLSKQNAEFTSHMEKVLSSVSAVDDSRAKVRLLVDGMKSWPSFDTTSTESNSGTPYLKNVQQFLRQAEHDPGIGASSVSEWERKLTQSLKIEAVKFEYSELFGRLLTEWVDSPAKMQTRSKEKVETGVEASTAEPVAPTGKGSGRKEMHEERAKFEAYVAVPKETDAAAIEAYLENLYSLSKESRNQLDLVRARMKTFGEDLLRSTFTVEQLEWIINSLLTKDLLSNEKRATLGEFMLNKAVLKEVADVLNMHLTSLSSWSWPAGGVPIEMRRYLNGKYRNFMEEDLLQALFLHFLGVKWAIEFKQAFRQIYKSRAWKASSTPLSKTAIERREYFFSESPLSYVNDGYNSKTIEQKRQRMQEEQFFMSQLPDNMETTSPTYDSDTHNTPTASQSNPIATKQTLLYIMATECLLNTTIHDSFTVVGSDFFSFGSSLSHTSLLTMLKFYGVSEIWLTFFDKFLSAPLKFSTAGPPQVRKRGVPMAHSLSEVLGEVMLFCMDYAVNQRADGLFLYRLFDDLWFWNSDPEICAKAWKEMSTFAALVGLEFNRHKTGSVCVGQPLHPDLPKGPIKFGLLGFEPSGRFVIDESQVNTHIAELRLQLAACENSVFAWVQVYNKYVSSFFVTNFGSPPANCFGKSHIDMVINTLEKIHRELFPRHNGSVTAYLADVIAARFGVSGIPDGWYYWPLSMGGLEVKNPFIPLYILRDSICEDPGSEFKVLVEKDEESWAMAKERWDDGTTPRVASKYPGFGSDFMPLEEYNTCRVQRFTSWNETYCRLLGEPEDCRIELTTEIEAALKRVSADMGRLKGRGGRTARRSRRGRGSWGGTNETRDSPRVGWEDVSVYWQWVIACYGEGVIAKWGGLEVVRPGSLPVGMVDAWKSKRMRWDQ